jgi:tetratricopeptide (TPR) repeat protein
MAKKKLTRKELLKQPDEFLTLSSRLFNLTVTYKFQILAGFGAVLAIVAAFTFVRYYANKTEKDGFNLLQQNRVKYEAALQNDDPAEAYRQVQQDYDRLMEKYGNTRAGQLGKFVYADIAYRGGDTEKAVALYQESLDTFDDPYFKNQIFIGLGYAYEAQDRLTEALQAFEKVDPSVNAFQKGEALYNLGRLYAAMGEKDKSQEIYRKIISENADTIYLDLVRELYGG